MDLKIKMIFIPYTTEYQFKDRHIVASWFDVDGLRIYHGVKINFYGAHG